MGLVEGAPEVANWQCTSKAGVLGDHQAKSFTEQVSPCEDLNADGQVQGGRGLGHRLVRVSPGYVQRIAGSQDVALRVGDRVDRLAR